jgi:hypothetical protein
VAANLVPLYGVVFLRWDVFPLVFLYWLENVMACSPKLDPGAMRVSTARMGKETFDEPTEATHP